MTLDEAKKFLACFESRKGGYYDRNTFLWGPEEGEPILAKNLTMSHLCNIINWILDHDDQYNDGTLAFMVGEAKYRRLLAFAQNTAYVEATGVRYGSDIRAVLVSP